jgi:hypothetical protein
LGTRFTGPVPKPASLATLVVELSSAGESILASVDLFGTTRGFINAVSIFPELGYIYALAQLLNL